MGYLFCRRSFDCFDTWLFFLSVMDMDLSVMSINRSFFKNESNRAWNKTKEYINDMGNNSFLMIEICTTNVRLFFF